MGSTNYIDVNKNGSVSIPTLCMACEDESCDFKPTLLERRGLGPKDVLIQMKYCGVCTPFKGTLVYATAAMGMPGSETALEEVVSRVFGSLIQSDRAIKITDNLFTGGNSLDELCGRKFLRLLRVIV